MSSQGHTSLLSTAPGLLYSGDFWLPTLCRIQLPPNSTKSHLSNQGMCRRLRMLFCHCHHLYTNLLIYPPKPEPLCLISSRFYHRGKVRLHIFYGIDAVVILLSFFPAVALLLHMFSTKQSMDSCNGHKVNKYPLLEITVDDIVLQMPLEIIFLL